MFEYRNFCESLAQEAGKMILDTFENHGENIYDDDDHLHTQTDIAVNKLVIEKIQETYPGHDILGEEESFLENDSDHVWICDPIDGTIPFALGIPTACFSLGLVYQGRPIAAVCFDPFMKRMFYAEKGQGAWLGETKLSVNPEGRPKGVGVVEWHTSPHQIRGIHKEILAKNINFFDLGSIVQHGVLTAMGRLQGMVFPGETVHDIVAVDLLITEAGGICTDFDGNEIMYEKTMNGFIGAPKKMHDQLLEMVQKLVN